VTTAATQRADGSVIRSCETVGAVAFDALREIDAKRVCLSCPALFTCRAEVLALPVAGVAGGLTEAERAALTTPQAPSRLLYLDERTIVREDERRRSPEKVEIIRRRAAAGQNDGQIAFALGLAVETVGRIRRSHGIPAVVPEPEDFAAARRRADRMRPLPCPSWGALKRHRTAGERCEACWAFAADRERVRVAAARARMGGRAS
jgi:hypothetical protein